MKCNNTVICYQCIWSLCTDSFSQLSSLIRLSAWPHHDSFSLSACYLLTLISQEWKICPRDPGLNSDQRTTDPYLSVHALTVSSWFFLDFFSKDLLIQHSWITRMSTESSFLCLFGFYGSLLNRITVCEQLRATVTLEMNPLTVSVTYRQWCCHFLKNNFIES